MASLLDIISAMMIGGMLLVMSMSMIDTTSKYFYSYGDDLIVQENLTATTATLEYDLKKMGYGIAEGEQVVLQADSTHLKYLCDHNKSGSIDTVEYFLGSKSYFSHTPNPDDRFLYRRINGSPNSGFAIGVVTTFKFEYLNQDGSLIDTSIPSNLIAVKMIRITMKIESSAVYSSEANPDKKEYRTAFWQQTRLVSRNLRR